MRPDAQHGRRRGNHAIRANELQSGEHIPNIAVTAHALKGDQERCFAPGMDGYLSKSIRTSELLEALERLVDEAKSKESVEATSKPTGDAPVLRAK